MTNLKQIIGFLLTLLAGAAGLSESTELFLSFGSVVAATYILTDIFKGFFKSVLAVQVLSWVFSIGLSVSGWLLQLGVFAGFEWWFAIATGGLIGLVTNGIYDSYWAEEVWKFIKFIFTPKKEV